MKLIAKASLQIQNPDEVVFKAIVDPIQMTNYFITERSGRMETGKELTWKFADFPGLFPVSIREVVPNRSVSFV